MRTGSKFAAFDIDGTLIRWQLYHAVTDELARQNRIKPETYQTIRDARKEWKRRKGSTFKDYERQVIEIYESVLKTLTFDQFESAISAVFEEYKDQVYTYTRDLIGELKRKNYLLFAISGSQTEIVAKVADYYGFDDYVGTVYERSVAGFSGGKVIGSFNKDKTLRELTAKHKVGYAGSIAVGDSHSDASMLDLVEVPIAFNPDRELFEHASQKEWKVVIERKNMIYELAGRQGKYELVKTN